MNIFIDHNQNCHFETVFSYIDLLSNKNTNIKCVPIIKNLPEPSEKNTITFRGDFISNDKYKSAHILKWNYKCELLIDNKFDQDKTYEKHDFVIIDTVYKETSKDLIKYKNDDKFLLICHTKTKVYNDWDNVYYLTPMGDRYIIPHYFPFYKKTKKKTNLYIVQGSLQEKRRNYKSLVNIFKKYKDKEFTIRIIGKGGKLPSCLEPYMAKIDFRNNLNFHAYHQMFNEVAYILPLLDETFDHEYFNRKHSSSISYGIGYNMKYIAHSKLKTIYPGINGFFYDNLNDFVDIFGKSL